MKGWAVKRASFAFEWFFPGT